MVPAQGLAESLVHTEHSVKVSYLHPTVGDSERAFQAKGTTSAKKKMHRHETGGCFGVVGVCCARWG